MAEEEIENKTPEEGVMSLDEKPEQPVDVSGSLVGYITNKFHKSKVARMNDEKRWLDSYRNYRGTYSSDVQFTEQEKSRVFVKVTKTKVLAAYGQIVDVLFANNRFPISVDPTTIPEGVVESVHFDPKAPEGAQEEETSPYGFKGDGNDLPAGATLKDLLGPLKDDLEEIEGLKEGAGVTPTAITFHPAMIAAKRMEKKILDQLEESGASKQLRSTAFEMALLGTGIMKGPFAFDKEYPNWNEEGDYEPTIKSVPKTSHVSVWNFYPDPDASSMDNASYVIERQKLNRTQLRALKNRPYFREAQIEECIEMGETYEKEYWEDDLRDEQEAYDIDRFEVLEFWGNIDKKFATEFELDIPKEIEDYEELQVNAWICCGKIIRLVLNPFKPAKIPYCAVPYELNPYSFFGIGLAENMSDTQTLMNGFMRMAVDNAVLSGNLLIEVDETNLVPGQDLTVYPGKVFRRQGGAPGQAIFGTKFPNVSNENMQLFDKARQLADESTGLPSFSHGQTGVSGTGRTASGISMLMNAASISIKTVVKNLDDYLLRPLGERLFAFNMQFDFDPEIRGDLEVKARGTESLMANEVRSQRLMQFLQVASNPVLAPFAKMDFIIREIAKSMDLDPDKVTNNMAEAARQAELFKDFRQELPQPEMGEQPVAGANPMDTAGTGGGTIGTGQAPVPGEQGFTGNDQQANTGQTQAPSQQPEAAQQLQ